MRDWRGSYTSPNQGRLSQTTSESTSLGNAEVTPPCLGPSVVMGTGQIWAGPWERAEVMSQGWIREAWGKSPVRRWWDLGSRSLHLLPFHSFHEPVWSIYYTLSVVLFYVLKSEWWVKQTKMTTLIDLHCLLEAPDSKQIIGTCGVSAGNKGYIRRKAEKRQGCRDLRQGRQGRLFWDDASVKK